MPAVFMYSYSFGRNEMAIGAVSSIMMMALVLAIVIPYLVLELRGHKV
jgi:glucose/mannose transport system permease protein